MALSPRYSSIRLLAGRPACTCPCQHTTVMASCLFSSCWPSCWARLPLPPSTSGKAEQHGVERDGGSIHRAPEAGTVYLLWQTSDADQGGQHDAL